MITFYNGIQIHPHDDIPVEQRPCNPIELHYFINKKYYDTDVIGQQHIRIVFSCLAEVEKKIRDYWFDRYTSPTICWQRIVFRDTQGVIADELDLRNQLEWLKKLRQLTKEHRLKEDYLRRAERLIADDAIDWARRRLK